MVVQERTADHDRHDRTESDTEVFQGTLLIDGMAAFQSDTKDLPGVALLGRESDDTYTFATDALTGKWRSVYFAVFNAFRAASKSEATP